jgi:hypothetical protein
MSPGNHGKGDHRAMSARAKSAAAATRPAPAGAVRGRGFARAQRAAEIRIRAGGVKQ